MTSESLLQQIIDAFPHEVMIVDANATIKLLSRTIQTNQWCNAIKEKSLFKLIDENNMDTNSQSLRGYFNLTTTPTEDQYFNIHIINPGKESIPYSITINPTTVNTDNCPNCFSITFNKTGESNIITTPSSYLHTQYLEMIYNNTSDAIFLAPISPEGVHNNFIEVNQTACNRLGYTREELLRLNARSINPSANLTRVKAYGDLLKKEGYATFEAIHLTKNGEHIPVDVHATIIHEGIQAYVLSVVKDLRTLKKTESSISLFGRLMDSSWNEIYVMDSTSLNIKMVNEGARKNLGIKNSEFSSYKFSDLLVNTTDEQFLAFSQELFAGQVSQLIYESKLKRMNGSTYPVEVRLQLSQSEVPPLLYANVQDISERKKIESRLTYMASYDSLTGLPNKALYLDRLAVAMEAAKRLDTLMAVMFIDLDGFKQVNDTHGHEIGDLLIREVAKRLVKSTRKSDTVSRFGGDEFTIILNNINSVNGIQMVVKKIMKNITERFVLDGKEVLTSPSIGITIYPFNDADDASELLRQADIAMYHVKKVGKRNASYYSSELSVHESRKNIVESAVRNALLRKELELFFQPRVKLSDGSIVGAEVLLRWQKSTLGFVSPVEFIPLMEKTGVINDVGEWVLRESCIQLRKWLDMGHNFRISVNLSAKQFDGGELHILVDKILEETQVPADKLELEITEGLLIDQSEDAIFSLEQMSKTGVTISLDDFGTGYSSLSYLKQFPIDILKIDRSFVMDLKENKDSLVIVEAIIGLAKNMGLSVTAEGIEEKWHAEYLAEQNCDEGQGYYFARPMPQEEMQKILEDSKRQALPIKKS